MFRINWFRFYSHLKIGVLASFILKISNFLMAVEIKPFYGFPYILVIFFSKFHMPKLIYKMYLPHRLWKNKKDEFCRFNEEHSLIGSGSYKFWVEQFLSKSLWKFLRFVGQCALIGSGEWQQGSSVLTGVTNLWVWFATEVSAGTGISNKMRVWRTWGNFFCY